MSKQNKNDIKIKVNRIYNMDCLDGLKKLPDKSVDLAFIDPPFNTGKDFGVYKDNLLEERYSELMQNIINELKRVTKRGFGIYLNLELFQKYLKMVPQAKAISVLLGNIQHPYIILITAKKLKELQNSLDIICLTDEEYLLNKKRFDHPSQTSPEITKWFLEYFSKEGEIILDCFMGSGTTAIVCKRLNRNFIGFEINPEYCKIANERLLQINLNARSYKT